MHQKLKRYPTISQLIRMHSNNLTNVSEKIVFSNAIVHFSARDFQIPSDSFFVAIAVVVDDVA